MKTITESILDRVNGNRFGGNKTLRASQQEADLFLVQTDFKNSFKDWQLSKCTCVSKLSEIKYRECWKESLSVSNAELPLSQEELEKVLKEDLKGIVEVERVFPEDIYLRLPYIKMVPLKSGEPIPNAQAMWWFGDWFTKTEVMKAIKQYINSL